ncbi:ribosome small subunit-dependent GTPase A [Streptobacillus moniliformis]|uniref:Small ribosomal subunit biogenesis GTPase RsgA n=1 Tax=Streptobacillus moniliformis (strain ATCC 14647 / DSM 12112 / NCTC 10651 / 9901) TaxID=519441 RepID=D1AV99_STRM9|nr:ribosome small subunit-dependent GTPase A [Streptobacillus moniliformis]ACZ01659.1 ribosome small subunit-dependent GTPase A [Streptobacillus moniliformis DSM 12112]SQA13163.1 Putative ribosome biogenesis GTPase RsgA [Streptobacillus moniliformis]
MIIEGKVIRKIQGFYFVYTNYTFNDIDDFENKLIKCKLRGNLKIKNKKDNCIIGDNVLIDTELNIIIEILERKNFLNRPLISNIDNLAITFAAKEPNFDIIQFQKLLLNVHKNNLVPLLLITKFDLMSEVEKKEIDDILKENFPYLKYFFISHNEYSEFKEYIYNKNIIISGPSGVGKSTLINNILGQEILVTGDISQKTKKGKNTTVDTRFFPYNNGFIIDTPGFSSIEFPNFKDYLDIREYFPEINELSSECKFSNCIHIHEPNCNVKKKLNKLRYDFYKLICQNIQEGGR